MVEKIMVKRYLRAGVVVTVTQAEGNIRITEAERVLAPTPSKIASAIKRCRTSCAFMFAGVALADEVTPDA